MILQHQSNKCDQSCNDSECVYVGIVEDDLMSLFQSCCLNRWFHHISVASALATLCTWGYAHGNRMCVLDVSSLQIKITHIAP